MNILGISAYYHDSSACLFQKGKLVYACEEEKFTGIKHDSSFPINSINYILENYTDKIDLICYYENPKLKLKRALKHNIKSVPRILWTNVKLFFKLNKICRNIFYYVRILLIRFTIKIYTENIYFWIIFFVSSKISTITKTTRVYFYTRARCFITSNNISFWMLCSWFIK